MPEGESPAANQSLVQAESDTPSKVLVTTQQGLTHKVSMDLEAARTILRAVVDLDEATITEQTDLTRAGEYTMDQVRQALRVISEDILGAEVQKVLPMVEKQTRHGRLHFALHKEYDAQGKIGKPINAHLSLSSSRGYVLESVVPVRDSSSWVLQDAVRFSDFRHGTSITSVYDLMI